MSKKIFSLINGGEIRLEPGTKIIPASSISTALTAEEIQISIKADAEKYRQTVVEEIEEIKAKARIDGYEEGFNEWAKHVDELEEMIHTVRRDFEKIIVPVALKASQKILGRELENNPEAIVDIVSTSLKTVNTHKKITIYVSPKERGILEANKNRLKNQFELLESFQIVDRNDMQPGGLIIETEKGIINAELANVWQTLERAFGQIFKKKNELPKPDEKKDEASHA